MSHNAIAFMSYAHSDDKHEKGRLSEFRERLSGEVHMQTGEDFDIFQDRDGISWGQQWQQRIDGSLDGATFLIPIITPSYFKSKPCCEELRRFLDREKGLNRADLILPVYYVSCPILNDETKRASEPLAQVIAARQYVDWRELRFEPFTAPQIGRMLEKMATQITEAIERSQPPVKGKSRYARASVKCAKPVAKVDPGQKMPRPQSAERPRWPAQKTEPPTLVVDALHRGDHPTLTAALAAAKPGHRILVRPGLYREGIIIDKPVEIIGDGNRGDIVVEATGTNAIHFEASMGRITNLTLRQMGSDDWYCVNITQGRLDLEGCDISSQNAACVGIHGGADPRLRRNRIHDGKGAGVWIYDNGQGTLEDNDIFANELDGVEISEGGNPTLLRNRIHDGKRTGVYVHANGQGTLEDNDIFANIFPGVWISEGGNPTLRRNRIHDCKESGLHVCENGQGIVEDNDIFANGLVGVSVRDGGNPVLRHNCISKNACHGIWVFERGGGVFEDNDLRGNAGGAWDIAADCVDKVKRERNLEQ